ncbi:MAG: hypothetical protein H7259_01270 [Cytophagales bacterium]|nr:hypothetical protein [Cytophaga sp.]
MKKLHNIRLFGLILLLAGCTSNKSITALHNALYFKDSPVIATTSNRYFLRFRYSDDVNALRYYMSTSSEIRNDTLIFYIPATSSTSNVSGQLQFEEIITQEKINGIKHKNVYWQEPDGTLSAMNIEPLNEEELLIIKNQTSKRLKH